jgi:hypothetical protein
LANEIPLNVVRTARGGVCGYFYIQNISAMRGVKLFISFLFAFVFQVSSCDNRANFYIAEIKIGYKGIIVDKYQARTTILKIQTTENSLVEASILCDGLICNSEIGDSIVKIPNENYVLLKKKSSVTKYPYLYIHKSIRLSTSWPKEWRTKWLESTEDI